MKSNRIMDMNVMALTPTEHQASMRSAGQEGVILYELLVERDMARTHVKLAKEQHGIKHVPFWVASEYESGVDAMDELILVGSDMDDFPSNDSDNYGDVLDMRVQFSIIRLHGFDDITSVQENFLFGCRSLTTINFLPLRNVTEIEDWFLANCTSLTTIDLAPLENVTEVNCSFMSGCSSLTTIDLTPLRNITVVQSYFLSYCHSLTTIDLAPLKNVTEVRCNFMIACRSLNTIDLAPLRNVTEVQSRFLANCSSLITVDLSPLVNLSEKAKASILNVIHEGDGLTDLERI